MNRDEAEDADPSRDRSYGHKQAGAIIRGGSNASNRPRLNGDQPTRAVAQVMLQHVHDMIQRADGLISRLYDHNQGLGLADPPSPEAPEPKDLPETVTDALGSLDRRLQLLRRQVDRLYNEG